MIARPVTVTIADGIAHVRLNRPQQGNALDMELARCFADAVERARADDVRAIVLSGAGPRFCVGGDLSAMLASEAPAAYVLELADLLDGALQELAALAKPVVAAVHGSVAGAALGIMLTADLVVASTNTVFLTAYSAVALTPDCGVSWLLPRAVGQQRALELALTGRRLDSGEALTWGLLTEVVDTNPVERAITLASELAGPRASAYGQARRLIREAATATRAVSGADESRTIARAVVTPEATSLIEAFVGR